MFEFIAVVSVAVLLVNGQPKGTTDLLQELFRDYDDSAVPRYNVAERVDINISIGIWALAGLNEKKQVMTLTGWFQIYWIDEFLIWNKTKNNPNALTVSAGKVWLPDLVISNAETNYGRLEEHMSKIIIENTGLITWYPGGSYNVFCKVNIRYFPFDTQKCKVIVVVWAGAPSRINVFALKPFILKSVFEENPEWEFEAMDVFVKYTYVYYKTPYIHFTFTFKRRYTFYIINIILPAVVLSLLINLVFILPVESGEKVSLSISVLLSYIVLLTLVSDLLPNNSDQISLLGVYLIVLVILSSMSTLVTVLVLYLHGNINTPDNSALDCGTLVNISSLSERPEQDNTWSGMDAINNERTNCQINRRDFYQGNHRSTKRHHVHHFHSNKPQNVCSTTIVEPRSMYSSIGMPPQEDCTWNVGSEDFNNTRKSGFGKQYGTTSNLTKEHGNKRRSGPRLAKKMNDISLILFVTSTILVNVIFYVILVYH